MAIGDNNARISNYQFNSNEEAQVAKVAKDTNLLSLETTHGSTDLGIRFIGGWY